MQERANVVVKPKTVFSGLNTKTVEQTVQRAQAVTSKTRVVHGANEGYFPVAGKTVGDVRKGLRDVFNLPGDAIAEVDGKQVNDEFVLAANQTLEFSKEAGVKGK